MIRIIFITILFLSSNLFAATYLLCENDEHSHQIKLGNQDLNRVWKMKQEKLSPKFTTLLNEIIKVK